MFYFGLNDDGLINSHEFDRKISTNKPALINSQSKYPWLTAAHNWSPELLVGQPAFASYPMNSIIHSILNIQNDNNNNNHNINNINHENYSNDSEFQ